jgi:hypothetical protein
MAIHLVGQVTWVTDAIVLAVTSPIKYEEHGMTLPLNSGLHRLTIMRTFCLAAGPQTSVAQTSWD